MKVTLVPHTSLAWFEWPPSEKLQPGLWYEQWDQSYLAPAPPTLREKREVCHNNFHSHFCTKWLICLINNMPTGSPEEVGESPPGHPQCGEVGGLGSNAGAGRRACFLPE